MVAFLLLTEVGLGDPRCRLTEEVVHYVPGDEPEVRLVLCTPAIADPHVITSWRSGYYCVPPYGQCHAIVPVYDL